MATETKKVDSSATKTNTAGATLAPLPLEKMGDSVSTNFQWQKAFSKGDQSLEARKKNLSLEHDFTH